MQAQQASWHLTLCFPSGPWALSSGLGGCLLAHPVVPMIQAMSKLFELLVALPDEDDLMRKLSLDANGSPRAAGVTTPGSSWRAWPRSGSLTDVRPTARLLQACCQPGLDMRLPAVSPLAKYSGGIMMPFSRICSR